MKNWLKAIGIVFGIGLGVAILIAAMFAVIALAGAQWLLGVFCLALVILAVVGTKQSLDIDDEVKQGTRTRDWL